MAFDCIKSTYAKIQEVAWDVGSEIWSLACANETVWKIFFLRDTSHEFVHIFLCQFVCYVGSHQLLVDIVIQESCLFFFTTPLCLPFCWTTIQA